MKNLRLKIVLVFSLIVIFLFGSLIIVSAHFGMVIPSDDIISKEDNKSISLTVQFIHPMEGDYMDIVKPAQLAVLVQGKKIDLLSTLQEKKIKDCATWETNYQIKRPGDYIFYVEPQPYWEPAEDCFIIHLSLIHISEPTRLG